MLHKGTLSSRKRIPQKQVGISCVNPTKAPRPHSENDSLQVRLRAANEHPSDTREQLVLWKDSHSSTGSHVCRKTTIKISYRADDFETAKMIRDALNYWSPAILLRKPHSCNDFGKLLNVGFVFYTVPRAHSLPWYRKAVPPPCQQTPSYL